MKKVEIADLAQHLLIVSRLKRRKKGGGIRCEKQSFSSRRRRRSEPSLHGGKKVKGRKRHMLVDTLGLLLEVIVTEANGSERSTD